MKLTYGRGAPCTRELRALCNAVGKPTPQKTRAPAKAGSAVWLVTALLVLSAIPLAFGAFHLTQLAGGAEMAAVPAATAVVATDTIRRHCS
jgi:hypothetical protein